MDILLHTAAMKGEELMNCLTQLKSNLENKGYIVSMFDTKEDAAKYLNEEIDGKTVGFGGSVTLQQMGLLDLLSAHNTVYWHDQKPDYMTVSETRLAAAHAEIYLSSVNGISMQGEIVNIDNTGNRVAALCYGPEKVYLVIGINKVAEDYESALFRARNVAAPMNARRLKRKTPCASFADKCYDCRSDERICRTLSVFWIKPAGIIYEVILVNEPLGF